jgi:hypothetical protein
MQRVKTLDQEIAAILRREDADLGIHLSALEMLNRCFQHIRWNDGRSSIFYTHRGVLIQIGFLASGAYEAWWTCS